MLGRQWLWVLHGLIAVATLPVADLQSVFGDYCPPSEQAGFISNIADISILAAKCDFMYLPSKQCCDTVEVMAQHPCAAWADKNYVEQDTFSSPSNNWDFLMKGLELCRLRLGGYHIGEEECGDGLRNSTLEQCDDGNALDGDGCSECFIDDGFDCVEVSENGTSTCRMCAETCWKQYRTICTVAGGACGECLDGYALHRNGHCGRVKTLLYAPINRYREASTTNCSSHFYEVGSVIDPGPFGSAEDYIRVIREWKPDRSEFLNAASCSLYGAFRRVTIDRSDVLIAAEILVDEVWARNIYVDDSQHALVFSDGKRRTIDGQEGGVFDVYFGSKLFLYNVNVVGCRGSTGGFLENFGEAIIENVTVSECADKTVETLYYSCTGHLIESMGPALKLHNVLFTKNEFGELVGGSQGCMVYMHTLVSLAYNSILINVTFEENYSEGVMVHIRHTTDVSVFQDLQFIRNTCDRSLLVVDLDAVFSNLTLVGNTVKSSAAVVVSGKSTLEGGSLVANEVVEDVGVFTNLGRCDLYNVVVADNTSPRQIGGGAVLNKGIMSVESSVFENNAVGAIRSLYWLSLRENVFRRNVGTQQFSTIHNTGYLEMSMTNITDTATQEALTVMSEDPFIARDCVLPDAEALFIAKCDEVLLLPDGSMASTCGVNAICTDSELDGRHCTCPSDYLGDPFDVCSPVPSLHILPEPEFVSYMTKVSTNQTSVEVLGIGSNGFGELLWEVDITSLPGWAVVAPVSGYYSNKDNCISIHELTLTLSLNGITAADPIRHATIRFITNATVDGRTYPSEPVELAVSLHVEAPSNATWSMVSLTDESLCDIDGHCVVEGGRDLGIVVWLFDAGGDPVGIGGTAFSVRVLQVLDYALRAEEAVNLVLVSLEDFGNGSYVASFPAPQMSFVVVVDINGERVSGTPLVFDVVCGSEFVWSSAAGPGEAGMCVEQTLSVPKHVVAAVLVLLTVSFVGTFSWLYRNRRYFEELFQLIMTEVFSLTLCGIVEFLDLMSDIGAIVSVLLTDDLQVYAPYYLVVVPFSLLLSVAYFVVLLSDMRKALRKKQRRSEYGGARPMLQNVYAVGVGSLETVEEVAEAIRQLDSKERRMFLELVLMFVEDVPMLTLSLFIITENHSTPLAVYIAMMLSAVMLGVTLTNFRGIKEARRQRVRLQLRCDEAVRQLEENASAKHRVPNAGPTGTAGLAKKKGLGAVVLEVCTVS
eukprot:Rmarinus@m.4941